MFICRKIRNNWKFIVDLFIYLLDLVSWKYRSTLKFFNGWNVTMASSCIVKPPSMRNGNPNRSESHVTCNYCRSRHNIPTYLCIGRRLKPSTRMKYGGNATNLLVWEFSTLFVLSCLTQKLVFGSYIQAKFTCNEIKFPSTSVTK